MSERLKPGLVRSTRLVAVGIGKWRLPNRESGMAGLGITLGLLSGGLGPWIMGALIDSGGFDIQQASLMVTIEQITMGVVMIGLTAVLNRVPRMSLIVAGIVLVLLSQAMSFLMNDLSAMATSRALSGVGFAFIYVVSTALGATTRDPDRTFAIAQGMIQVTAMVLSPAAGFGSELPGHKGIFVVIELFAIALAAPFLFLALAHRTSENERPADRTNAATLRWNKIIGVLAVMTIYSIATGGAWNFMERIGRSVGLSGGHLGSGLVVAGLLGTLGSVAATRLGTSYGRVWPLCGGIVALGLATVWFMVPGSAPQFWIVVSLWAFLFTFTTPYVFGLAAAADPSGRIAAASGTAYILVSAIGVYFGAQVVAHTSLIFFGLVALGLLASTALLAAFVIRDGTCGN